MEARQIQAPPSLQALQEALDEFNINLETCDVFEETLLKLANIKQKPARCLCDFFPKLILELDIDCSQAELVKKLNARFPRLRAQEGFMGQMYPSLSGSGLMHKYGSKGTLKYIIMNTDHFGEDIIPAIISYLRQNPEIVHQYAGKPAVETVVAESIDRVAASLSVTLATATLQATTMLSGPTRSPVSAASSSARYSMFKSAETQKTIVISNSELNNSSEHKINTPGANGYKLLTPKQKITHYRYVAPDSFEMENKKKDKHTLVCVRK